MKDPFDALSEEFKDLMESASPEVLTDTIAKVAMADADLRKAQEEDEDLAAKKEQVKLASEPYREGFKLNRLKIKFMKQILEDKGKA